MLVVAGLTLSAFVQASPILLDTITHNYGNQHYVPNSVKANKNPNCDSAAADWLVIKDRDNGCQRFYDNFNLTNLMHQSIDRFELKLTFSEAGSSSFFGSIPTEFWTVRPSLNAAIEGEQYFYLNRAENEESQTFTFTRNNLAIFDDIVNANNFSLWFAEFSLGTDAFKLHNASWSVCGVGQQNIPENPDNTVTVPAPAGIALFGLGLTLMGLTRRNKRK